MAWAALAWRSTRPQADKHGRRRHGDHLRRDGRRPVTPNTARGLYTSLDAGLTWTYDALVDKGGATDATSATAVAYNASAACPLFAAVRYHGFYSSPDGDQLDASALISLAGPCSAPQPARRNRHPTVAPVPSIAPKSQSFRPETKCTPGTFRWIRAATLSTTASGRVSTGGHRGPRFPTRASQIAAISMAAASNRAPTIWNCWPYPTRRARTCTREQSISTSARSIRKIRELHLLSVCEPHSCVRMCPHRRTGTCACRTSMRSRTRFPPRAAIWVTL